MTSQPRWVGILRCATWNVWPEKKTISFPSLDITYGKPESSVLVQAYVASYKRRSDAGLYLREKTGQGPSIFYFDKPGLHRIRGVPFSGADEGEKLTAVSRNAYRGEIDIRLTFGMAKLPKQENGKALREALRAHAFEILSLLNLTLADFVTPTMEFQIHQTWPDDAALIDVRGEIRDRRELSDKDLDGCEASGERLFSDSGYDEKYRVALDLYAAHLTEQQARVRFILLVVAMEALTEDGTKHPLAVDLLDKWEGEVKTAMRDHPKSSDEYKGLKALHDQFDFARESGKRARIRRLFESLPSIDTGEAEKLKRRALVVYDARSALVHTGKIPADDFPPLDKLEEEARVLLEMLFKSLINRSQLAEVSGTE